MEREGRPQEGPHVHPPHANRRGGIRHRPGGNRNFDPRRNPDQPLGNQGGQREQGAVGRWGNDGRRGNHNPPGGRNRRPPLHPPYQDRAAGGEQPVRRLGYKALEGLLDKEPSEVVITLASHSGLQELLSGMELKSSFVELLCKVLCRACSSRLDRQSKQHLLGQVKSSFFLRTCLPHYVVGMMTESIPERRHCYPEHISNILLLLQELISIFPASSVQETSMLVSLLPASINALRASGVDIGEPMEESLERVTALIQHLQDRRREGTLRVDTHMVLEPETPAESYRTMSVYPTYDEIHRNDKPFLRPNTLSSKYESTDLYLDTHFRLLREDFVRPLRDGIREILQHHDDHGFRQRRFDDIRVYFDTRVVVPLCAASGIVYNVHFDTAPLKMVRWQNSKRLLYGSLVCLSQDNFESFLFATVSNRDAEELAKGEVQLLFSEQNREQLARTRPTDSFLMVETTAYFEAYRHVLEGLQAMNIQDMPFQKYIVSCQ
ncbi:hypothetical protein FKM82_027398, partial [Ascaphus truei]